MREQRPSVVEPRLTHRDQKRPLATPMTRNVGDGPTIGVATNTHAVPPAPHFRIRFTPIDRADLHGSPRPEQVPDRSLTSLPVLASLGASVAALCFLGWISMRSPDGLTWSSVKAAITSWGSNETVPDDELPYITAVPMIPDTLIADNGAGSSESDRVAMTDSEDKSTETRKSAKIKRR